MKLAFSTLGCPDWSFNEIFSTAKDLGFDGVEIRGVGNELYAPSIPQFGPEKVGKTLEKLQRLGVEYIRILGDDKACPSVPVKDDDVKSEIIKIAGMAEEKGVTLLLETNGVYSDTARAAALVISIGSDSVAVLWDVHHPIRYNSEPPERSFENLVGLIRYIHIKDSINESGEIKYRMMGFGDMPIKEILALLRQNGYDGYISLEWVKRWCAELEAPGVVFMQYISYMRKALGSNKQ